MSFILGGTIIRSPNTFGENNSTQKAENRVLSGAVKRDFFGSNKRVWTLNYTSTNPTDYATTYAIYSTYLSSGNTVSWQVTEANYPISSVQVHVDLQSRNFSIRGNNYLSDYTLILTEA